MNKGDLIRELQKINDVTEATAVHFMHEGQMNAALHMSNEVRYAPLAAALMTANDNLNKLIMALQDEDKAPAEWDHDTEGLLRRAQYILANVSFFGFVVALIVEPNIVYSIGSSADQLRAMNIPGSYLEIQGTSVWYSVRNDGAEWAETLGYSRAGNTSFVIISKTASDIP